MARTAPSVRLRQAVIAAGELEPVAGALRSALGLGEPFRDPGVSAFGLHNAVFAIGDCFIEVISPTGPGTATGRWIERHGGDGGYMAIFDLQDAAAARERAAALGVRTAWQIELPDISAAHLHPADMRGAIVSLDSSRPYGTWRWGGPEWTGRTGTGAPGRLVGITLALADPSAGAARWGEVLGVPVDGASPLGLDGAAVRFEPAPAGSPEDICEIALELPHELPGGASSIRIGGVRITRLGPGTS
jgi:hypothetical protein